jgi:hypothetical protein
MTTTIEEQYTLVFGKTECPYEYDDIETLDYLGCIDLKLKIIDDEELTPKEEWQLRKWYFHIYLSEDTWAFLSQQAPRNTIRRAGESLWMIYLGGGQESLRDMCQYYLDINLYGSFPCPHDYDDIKEITAARAVELKGEKVSSMEKWELEKYYFLTELRKGEYLKDPEKVSDDD